MAQDKKSIIVYAEWIDKFEALSDEEAGKLIKHFFRYVNDLNPEAPDRITEISFISIKQSLKRDLKQWEAIKEARSKAGKIGGNKSVESKKKQKEANQANALNVKQNQSNQAVNVNVNVNDDDIVKSTSTLFTITMFEALEIGQNEFTRYACSQTKRTPEQIIKLKDEFVKDQKGVSKLSWPSETDAKRHFIAWVKKQPLVPVKPAHLIRVQ